MSKGDAEEYRAAIAMIEELRDQALQTSKEAGAAHKPFTATSWARLAGGLAGVANRARQRTVPLKAFETPEE